MESPKLSKQETLNPILSGENYDFESTHWVLDTDHRAQHIYKGRQLPRTAIQATMPTTVQTLQHVFDVLDIQENARTYLIEKEGCLSVTTLAQNTPTNWIGIRTKSNGILHYTDVNFLQIFHKWYNANI